jgi:predicted metal-binding membrane protein
MLKEALQERGFGPFGLLLWSVSLSAFIILAGGEGLSLALPMICGSASIDGSTSIVAFTLQTVGWPTLAANLALMIIAMMMPGLAGPLLRIWYRSLTRHRWRGILLFLLGYILTWLAACCLLLALVIVLETLVRPSALVGWGVVAAGFGWQFLPLRARCLARCHIRPRLSIFGLPALLDPIAFGVTHAGWCITTCWALMLIPLFFSDLHLELMAAAALLIANERFSSHGRKRVGIVGNIARHVARWRKPASLGLVWEHLRPNARTIGGTNT